MSAVIAFEGLTKKFGAVTALDDLTAEVAPGRITAFLGPNGSGKTTSMRLLLGLDAPTAGYGDHRRPSVRDAGAPDPGGRARSSTRASTRLAAHATTCASSPPRPATPRAPGRGRARPGRAGRRRPTGGSAATRSACGSVSRWPPPWSGTRRSWSSTSRSTGSTRTASRPCGSSCAGSPTRGGTVFLSSHLLAEVAHSADDAIIIDHGRLVARRPGRRPGRPTSATFVVAHPRRRPAGGRPASPWRHGRPAGPRGAHGHRRRA